MLRVITPTLASSNYLGKDCIACHQVPEGTVLGVVSMKVSSPRHRSGRIVPPPSDCPGCGHRQPVLLALIFYFTRHFVTRPIEQLEQGLREIAHGEGDLTRRLPVRSQDEIGQTAGISTP